MYFNQTMKGGMWRMCSIHQLVRKWEWSQMQGRWLASHPSEWPQWQGPVLARRGHLEGWHQGWGKSHRLKDWVPPHPVYITCDHEGHRKDELPCEPSIGGEMAHSRWMFLDQHCSLDREGEDGTVEREEAPKYCKVKNKEVKRIRIRTMFSHSILERVY